MAAPIIAMIILFALTVRIACLPVSEGELHTEPDEEKTNEEEDILEQNRKYEEQERNGLGVFVMLKQIQLISSEGIDHVAYLDPRNMVVYTQIAPVEDLMRNGWTWKEM